MPRYFCNIAGCEVTVSGRRDYRQNIQELSRHFKAAHPGIKWDLNEACTYHKNLPLDEHKTTDPKDGLPINQKKPATTEPADLDLSDMNITDQETGEAAGRPQREKKPTEKVKIATQPKVEEKEHILPPRYLVFEPENPKWSQEAKEIVKIFDHTKTSKLTGEKYDFYKLGNHVESRDKHKYSRARRDPASGHFRAAEAPPHYARLSDEEHPLCTADRADIVFTKDMLGTSHSNGHTTSRANVFAREGTYYFETKLLSMSHAPVERPNEPLATTDATKGLTKEDTCRGSVRIGLARREHHFGMPIGATGYSYGVVTFGSACDEYGNVRYLNQVSKVYPKNPGGLKEGDVVGLMITLPSLAIHQKVVQGTFDKAHDAPSLKCGPWIPEEEKTKPTAKSGAKRAKAKKDAKKATPKPETGESSTAQKQPDPLLPPVKLDIIRDRAPFEHKKIIYFDYPEYTVNRDIQTPAPGKGKSINPATKQIYDLTTDTHPNHALPHLRTLPGSKIEMWVNGEYQGIVWENLLAFLPPASYIDKTQKSQAVSGAIDDGTLGYYPAVSTYGGGAAKFKFDAPFDFPPKDRPEARPFGERYQQQIVDDAAYDVIDEAALEMTEAKYGAAVVAGVAPPAINEA